MVSLSSSSLYTAFALLGAAYLSYQVYQVASFIHLHFFHSCRLDHYRKANNTNGRPAWALVTGATDGIGRAFAEELCQRGFNVVVHGRNEQKLQNLKSTLMKQWPKQEVRTLQVDAGKEPFDTTALERGLSALQDLNITVLINNVGGSGGAPAFVEVEKRTPSEIATFMNVNSRFPTQITTALLPQLFQSSPAVIVNIGSVASEFGLPYLGLYAGCKSYNKTWSRSLAAEMRAEKRDIEVLFLYVGAVATGTVPRPLTLFVPSAKKLAISALNKIGCGRTTTFAYWAHEVQSSLFWALPEWIADRAVIDVGKQEKADEEVRLGAH